jgi:hypothetical protein
MLGHFHRARRVLQPSVKMTSESCTVLVSRYPADSGTPVRIVRSCGSPMRWQAHLSPNIFISPKAAAIAVSSTDQPVRGGLQRYPLPGGVVLHPPRLLPAPAWGRVRPGRDRLAVIAKPPGIGSVVSVRSSQAGPPPGQPFCRDPAMTVGCQGQDRRESGRGTGIGTPGPSLASTR